MAPVFRSWITLAILLPVLAEIFVSLILVMLPSGASAEGFAYIVVLVGLIIAIPFTILVNLILVPRAKNWSANALLRSFAAPGFYTVLILVYYTGLWDDAIEPLLPRQQSKIETASGGWIDDLTWESFYVVNSYESSENEQILIERYVQEEFRRQFRQDPEYSARNEDFYFVPRENYDPIDLGISREAAIAIFQHRGADGESELQRVR